MRLLVLASANVIHARRWCEWFVGRGHDLCLATLEPSSDPSDYDYRLTGLPLPGVLRYPLARQSLSSLIREFRPEDEDILDNKDEFTEEELQAAHRKDVRAAQHLFSGTSRHRIAGDLGEALQTGLHSRPLSDVYKAPILSKINPPPEPVDPKSLKKKRLQIEKDRKR